MIDEWKFLDRVGSAPKDDDLERANCPSAGEPMHRMCGWCNSCDMPMWVCGCGMSRLCDAKGITKFELVD